MRGHYEKTIHDIFVAGLIVSSIAIAGAREPSQSGAGAPQVSPAAAAAAREQVAAAADTEVAAVMGSMSPERVAELAREARSAVQRAAKRMLVERAALDPTTGATTGGAQQQLTVVAEKGDVNGRARFSVPFGPNVDGQMTFTAPLTSGAATFATVDGLSANSSVNGSLKWTIWSRRVSVNQGSAADTAIAPLAAVTRTAETGNPTERALASLEIARRVAAAGGSASRLPAAVAARNGTEFSRTAVSPGLAASPARYYAAVVQGLPDLTAVDWAGYITGGAESNRVSVDYLTEDTFETKPFEKTTGLFALSGGISKMGTFQKPADERVDPADLEPIKRPLFFVGFAFKAGDSVTVSTAQHICRPLTGGAAECLDAPVGRPTTASTVFWIGELRFWSWGSLQSVGFNPRVTRVRQRPDSGDTRITTTVEAPIYFMHQVKDVNAPGLTFGSDLIGGVSAGWRHTKLGATTREGMFVTLFLTKAFGLP